MKDMGDLVTAALAAAGVRRAYMVPGTGDWLPNAINRHPDIALYCVRHESSAGFMAEADARLTGIPAVVFAGRSPGAANAANGIEAARDSSTPMLVLIYDTDLKDMSREGFQKLDLLTFYRPITKACLAARAEDSLPDLVSYALRLAVGGRPGPVALIIPQDLGGPASDWSPHTVGGLKPVAVPGAEAIADMAARLAQAKAPVIIAGGGALHCRDELVAVAEKFATGVYAGFRRQDVFPNDHPLYLGHLGMMPPPETLQALRDADLVLVIGSKLGEWTSQRFTLPLPGTAVMQIDTDPVRVGALHPSALGIVADVKVALKALLGTSTAVPRRDWAGHHNTYLAAAKIPPDRGQDGVDPAQVIRAMAKELPADTIMANCAGGYAGFVHTHWIFRHPHSQVASTTGTMGYSVPAAIAAKLAMPDRCVVANTGDGGFLMNGHELEVAVRYKVNIIIVVYNNRLLSGGGYLDPWDYSAITDVDFASYARAFGAQGITVRHSSELAEAFRTARKSSTVTLIDVKTDRAISSARLKQIVRPGDKPRAQ
jgi:acetolactate synthase-1/2/3 large subunit